MQQKTDNSLIVKVFFKKAMFNLGKNIKTHADFVTQIKNRFAELKNFSITFKESPVTNKNFEEIFTQQISQGQTSIKFEIHELPVQQVTGSKQSKSKKFSFNPREFEDEKEQAKKVSESKGSESEFEELKVEQGQKIQDQITDIDLSSIKIKVLIGDLLSNLNKEVGEEYKWKCTLINQASTDIPQGVYVRELATNKLISLAGMGAKEAEQMEFGPYVEKEMGKFTKFFQIVFKKSEQTMAPIGNRFGFVCEAIKKLDVKELSSKMYKKVTELKSFSASEKSTEYIMAKFKEMGIDDSNIRKYDDVDLIDMMESFNIND